MRATRSRPSRRSSAVRWTTCPWPSRARSGRWPISSRDAGRMRSRCRARSPTKRPRSRPRSGAVDRGKYALDDLAVKLGANALTGSFAVTTGGAAAGGVRPHGARARARGAADSVAAPWPRGTAAPAPASRAWLIPDTPVDFAPCASSTRGALASALTLADGRRFDDLRVALTLAGGRLDMSVAHVAALGGTVGQPAIDANKAGQATLHVKSTAATSRPALPSPRSASRVTCRAARPTSASTSAARVTPHAGRRARRIGCG